MVKIEIVQFDGGLYAARRTVTSMRYRTEISYLNLTYRNWEAYDSKPSSNCFKYSLSEVKEALALSGYATGIPISEKMVISPDEFTKMCEMAENDEGLRDMLMKAKEFYILKKK